MLTTWPLKARQFYPKDYRFKLGGFKDRLLWEIPDEDFPPTLDPLDGEPPQWVAPPPRPRQAAVQPTQSPTPELPPAPLQGTVHFFRVC